MNKTFIFLSFLMGVVVLSSNYLVQFPINYFDLKNILTYGAFSYPVAFLITDLANRKYGKDSAKKNGSTFFLRPYLTNSLKGEFGGKFLSKNTSVFNAEEGKLLVWPNFLQHGSHPYQGNEDRIIISANSTIDLLQK